MISPDFIQFLAPLGGILGAAGVVYTAISSGRLTAMKQEFDRDKDRREAIVADITRCETRLDELQASVRKWMGDYDDLHHKHLAECQSHSETRLALAGCQREASELKRQVEEITADREKLRAELSALEKLITRTITQNTDRIDRDGEKRQ